MCLRSSYLAFKISPNVNIKDIDLFCLKGFEMKTSCVFNGEMMTCYKFILYLGTNG